MGRADDLETDEEKARRLTGAAEALKLDDVAFLAETARKSVLDASERAAILTMYSPVERAVVTIRKAVVYGVFGMTAMASKRWRRYELDDKLAIDWCADR